MGRFERKSPSGSGWCPWQGAEARGWHGWLCRVRKHRVGAPGEPGTGVRLPGSVPGAGWGGDSSLSPSVADRELQAQRDGAGRCWSRCPPRGWWVRVLCPWVRALFHLEILPRRRLGIWDVHVGSWRCKSQGQPSASSFAKLFGTPTPPSVEEPPHLASPLPKADEGEEQRCPAAPPAPGQGPHRRQRGTPAGRRLKNNLYGPHKGRSKFQEVSGEGESPPCPTAPPAPRSKGGQ